MTMPIITLTFRRDLERCALLCESVDRWVASSTPHYLLVDARDRALFAPLANARRQVLSVEDMLPNWIMRVPWSKHWWLSLRTAPLRSWIVQQLVKLSVAEHIDAEGYIFVDSDVAFIRPFDGAILMQGERVRLFRVAMDEMPSSHRRWHRSAARLLGLPEPLNPVHDYIGNLITWRRDVLRQLQAHIAAQAGCDWRKVVCTQQHLSEYILYGTFVDHVLGDQSLHVHDDRDLCHCSWNHRIASAEDVRQFINAANPHCVAVLVQSNLGYPVSAYGQAVKAMWESPGDASARYAS